MFNLIIKDTDVGFENLEYKTQKSRTASRGIVVNGDKIALLYKSNKNEYKLPGGGIENDEEPTEAFKREILEETGCEVEIIEKLGTSEEFKSHTNFYQLSHIFLAKLIKDTNQLNLTEKEINEGSKPIWVTLDEAITLVNSSFDKLKESTYDKCDNVYSTRFVIKRDLKILTEYKKILNKNN